MQKLAVTLNSKQLMLMATRLHASYQNVTWPVVYMRWPKEIIGISLTLYIRNPSAYRDITKKSTFLSRLLYLTFVHVSSFTNTRNNFRNDRLNKERKSKFKYTFMSNEGLYEVLYSMRCLFKRIPKLRTKALSCKWAPVYRNGCYIL